MTEIIDLIEKSPCSFDNPDKICLSRDMLDKLKHFHEKIICDPKANNQSQQNVKSKFKCIRNSNEKPIDNEGLVNDMMSFLGVESQHEILTNRHFRDFVDNDYALMKEKRERFKPTGAWNSTQLLDNNMIDECMEQWSKKYKFYNIPFQMIDFYETGDELSTIDVPKLIKEGYETMGVVLNTDVSTGPGKHWFCLFIDARKLPYTIEYFNSSGSNPPTPVHRRMREIGHDINKAFSLKGSDRAQVVMANKDELQKSRTECGVWSLIYIYSRLEKKPDDWFKKEGVLDEHMYKFRERLFLNE